MNSLKIEKLNKNGWKVGSASDFLGLSAEESAYVELKVSLSRYLNQHKSAIQP